MKIEPKTVEPGFLKRSLFNSYDLIMRQPFFWCLYAIALLGIGYLFAQVKLSPVILGIFSFTIYLLFIFTATFVAFKSDTQKLSIEEYLLTAKEGFTSFTEYLALNRVSYTISFVLLIFVFYIFDTMNTGVEKVVDSKTLYENTIYFANKIIFLSALLLFNGRFEFFSFILTRLIEEKNLQIKAGIIRNYTKEATQKNVKLAFNMSLIPLFLVFLTLFEIFFVPIVLSCLIPVFLYVSFREIFMDMDKNQKVTEKESKTIFNVA